MLTRLYRVRYRTQDGRTRERDILAPEAISAIGEAIAHDDVRAVDEVSITAQGVLIADHQFKPSFEEISNG